jgi:hypothetical protein
VRYEQNIFRPDGVRMEPNAGNATMLFVGDTIERQTTRGSEAVTQKVAVPNGATPLLGSSLMIPFSYSYLTYELAFARAGAAQPAGETRWYLLGTNAAQMAPQALRVWHVSADSAEADYFGVARSGFKFDAAGRLIRSDWTATTYKYKVTRVEQVDAEAAAKGWAAQAAAGTGMGAYSPRDTARASLAGASVLVDYSRPARRGRVIWGDVVPWDRVWRLGADLATQLRTDAELMIGDAAIPAATYSLWLVPTANSAQLIVNKQTGQFGTQYDPRQDLVRIPMTRIALNESVERLTISLDNEQLRVAWADAAYTVALKRR